MGRDTYLLAQGCRLDLGEIDYRFSPSGGPGGQHANRAHSRVDATLDLDTVQSLSESCVERLRAAFGDTVRVTVDDERSQRRNRSLATDRLIEKMEAALRPRKRRRPTRRTRGSERRRLARKSRRSEVKKLRRRPRRDD